MQESTITSKGQTTLPKAVREALKLRPGDKLRYLILDNGEVRLLRTRPLASLAGALRHEGGAVSLHAMEEAIADGAAGQG
ncbi:AbrB/MazE/SpoVT family DNA-binding domain-containing protein [Oceaniglobus roseus]|uniref:AbrB/MazE/SpoVT family DNA-binding domain-containing protein n=1 Tax=Oceaniglobus roseus TaxID=1737570 RepID=UPI000C7F5501|nr:type II toxin-antitoxin system PrlF family antitoxin [Kandeliimicrobium roseum]